jgi:hypothetical protein
MDYFAGLDASLEAINICIVDGDGSVQASEWTPPRDGGDNV